MPTGQAEHLPGDQAAPAPATVPPPPCVYVLFHETNTGHSDESDGYIEAVYLTEDDAKRAELAIRREYIRNGEAVYWDADTEEERPEDWEHDFRVECWQVRPTPSADHAPRTKARALRRYAAELRAYADAIEAAR